MRNVGELVPALIGAQIQKTMGDRTYVVWLRHFGCRFYQEARLLLPPLRQRLEEAGVNLVCVVQGTPEEIAIHWSFPDIVAVGDPEKVTYRQMGFERTNLLKILLPSKALRSRRSEATAQGCSMNKAGMASPSSDILQLPGAALVDAAGRLLWVHRGRHTGDLDLSPEAVLRAVNQVATP